MNWAKHPQRLMGAVIVMIACLVAPPAAFAHTGHEHANHAEISTTAIGVVPAAENCIVTVVNAKAQVASLPQAPERCIGDCCTSSHACCAANLPLNTDLFEFSYNSAIRAFRNPPFRYGLDPQALRKPPRSLA